MTSTKNPKSLYQKSNFNRITELKKHVPEAFTSFWI